MPTYVTGVVAQQTAEELKPLQQGLAANLQEYATALGGADVLWPQLSGCGKSPFVSQAIAITQAIRDAAVGKSNSHAVRR